MRASEIVRRLTRRRFARRSDSDFRVEIEAHLDLEAERLRAQHGVPPNEAYLAARRAFGSVVAAQEQFHESQRFAWLDRIQRHLIYAWRGILRRPRSVSRSS